MDMRMDKMVDMKDSIQVLNKSIGIYITAPFEKRKGGHFNIHARSNGKCRGTLMFGLREARSLQKALNKFFNQTGK
jgi:hypothetical protein